MREKMCCYFESDEASVLFNMQNVATTAAKYRMMVLYHGCVRPAGEYRTYPNVLSMEAVQGEEWHKWFKYPTTENCLLYPFTRNILGSMDYTPLGTASSNGETYGFAIAKSVVYQSALQHFSNAASIYKKYNGLSLLNNIPTVWDETTVLDGAAGENISMIRRNGENYFYGAMTVAARTESLELGFLGEGEYNAYIYGDNEGGTALKITTKKVTNADVLDFDLLNKGGVAVMFTKEEINLDCYELTDGDVVAGGTKYEAESAENTLSGTAVVENSPLCSNGAYVGWIGLGANNTLQFNKIVVEKDGEYEIILSYSCNENRKVNVLVNGTDSYELIELNSGSWTETAKKSFKVTLKAGENTIQFGNASAYAPNIDYIIVKEAGEEGTLEDVNGTTPEADDTDAATVQNPTNNNKEDAGETTKADGKIPTTGDSSWGMVIAALMAMIVCAVVVVKERKA